MLSDSCENKIKINSKNKNRKSPILWKANNKLLNNHRSNKTLQWQ